MIANNIVSQKDVRNILTVRARLGMRSMDCQRFGICHIEDVDCVDFSVKRGSVVMRIVMTGEKIMLQFLRKSIHQDDLMRFETGTFQVGEHFRAMDSAIMKENFNFSLNKGGYTVVSYPEFYCVSI